MVDMFEQFTRQDLTLEEFVESWLCLSQILGQERHRI